MIRKENIQRLSYLVGGLALIVSTLVLFGWFLEIKVLLSLIPGAVTMMFNTALLFWVSGAAVLWSQKDNLTAKRVLKILAGFLILFSGFTLISFVIPLPFDLDNFFVTDIYRSELPGRMSFATALSFFILGNYFLNHSSKNLRIQRFSLFACLVVSFLSYLATVGYVINLPAEEKSFFLQSMAIHTALLFLVISLFVLIANPLSGFNELLSSQRAGSKLIRKLIPFIVFFPIALSGLYIYALHSNLVTPTFGITFLTVFFSAGILAYVMVVGYQNNKDQKLREELYTRLEHSNRELSVYKAAINRYAIVAITDRKGNILSVNKKFTAISGYSKSELIGQTHRIINSGHHEPDFFVDLWQTIASGKIWEGEIKNKAKNGSFYWVNTVIIPFKNSRGKIEQYVAVRQDITKKKEAEELLKSAHVLQLEQKNKELEQFAYIASHDLQEPLRTVSSFSELLQEDYKDKLDADGKQYLKFIRQSTARMRKLIRGLLDYSRIGKSEVKNEVDLNVMVNEILADLNSTITDSKAVVIRDELPTIQVFANEIRLLFQNLIGNAIKFRKPNKTPEIKVSYEKLPNFHKFCISDNGIGIAEAHFDKIFTIFQRLHLQNEFEGTGIGLAYCYKVVEIHNGKIWVESEANNGSRFYFTIAE